MKTIKVKAKFRSKYVGMFDETCSMFDKNNEEYNVMFLRQQELWFNDKLKVRGYVFLKDVYESLGMPITAESLVVGWVYDEKNNIGDNFIEFDVVKSKNGKVFIIDFNVDGDITKHLF